MRFLNRYLVVALFVVGLMSSGGFIIDSSCLAAHKCSECGETHEGRCAKHLCPECGKTHEGRCAAVKQTQARGKAATFKAAFTGAGASRVGNLTAGLSIIQSQAANMVSKSAFGPPGYGYGGYGGY